MSPAEAEHHMRLARTQAEGAKQTAIADAAALPMPEHERALRAAEKQFCLDLAAAAEATGGLVDARYYHQSAWWHEQPRT
jgi:hypothetical protein